MMNDVASDDEQDSELLRKQRKSLFGFQVLSAKMLRESVGSLAAGDDSEVASALPSCVSGRFSVNPNTGKANKPKKR